MKYIFLILISVLATSCNSQEKKENTPENKIEQKNASQIGEYVTSIFEDSYGHLWFGTIEKGIARYDGDNLKYFTKKDGLPSNRVTSVIQDSKGIYWFNTGKGLSKFDGNIFTNYVVKKNDFFSNMISQLLIDSKGNYWVGTWGGVYNFDGTNFTYFHVPYPKVTTQINEDTKNWITNIKEDADGNIWFTRDEYGASKYDGKLFTHFLKKDGLHSNNVVEIEFDKKGNIWFGTRVAEKDNSNVNKRFGDGGLIKYNGIDFIDFPELDGLTKSDVYQIYQDSKENIWIGTTNNGVYKYDGNDFTNYMGKGSEIIKPIMSVLEDSKGTIWLGCAGGLFKINPNSEIINITTNGPWK